MKRELIFRKPYMNSAGMLGFSPDPQLEIPWDSFGAFMTNPVSLRPRQPASQPDCYEYPGGVLLHSGLPNPGFTRVVEKNSVRWNKSALPIIVHLMADRPEETRLMVSELEGMDNILAVELGFAPLLTDDILLLTLELCRGEMPLIFSLAPEQVLSLGPRLIQEGAVAISLAAPRGAFPRSSRTTAVVTGDREWVSGRLYGPSLYPQSLLLIQQTAKLGLPIIGSGGILAGKDAETMLAGGALAVQLDVILWKPGPSN
jgi:dihydroorotate dehydrogenase (NAD+) catalytic subunit